MAATMHRDTARDQVVNSACNSILLDKNQKIMKAQGDCEINFTNKKEERRVKTPAYPDQSRSFPTDLGFPQPGDDEADDKSDSHAKALDAERNAAK